MASLGHLAAGIAHELNNPVGFIYGNMDILNQSFTGLTELLNYYEKAELTENTASGAAQIKRANRLRGNARRFKFNRY